jgi:hypothetical protein
MRRRRNTLLFNVVRGVAYGIGFYWIRNGV